MMDIRPAPVAETTIGTPLRLGSYLAGKCSFEPDAGTETMTGASLIAQQKTVGRVSGFLLKSTVLAPTPDHPGLFLGAES